MFNEITISIVSDHLGDSPGERDARDKDCNLTLKVVHPRLDEASLSSGSSSYVEGMHLEVMLVSCIEELKELLTDSTLHKQSSHRPARMIFSFPIYTTTNYLQLEDMNMLTLEGQELESRTQSFRQPLQRLFTKRRLTQSWRMISTLLKDCLASEYTGSEGAKSFSISSSGTDIQKKKVLGQLRRTYTKILLRSMRA